MIKHPLIDDLIKSRKHTSKEIAKIVGYNYNSVNTRAKVLKIKLPKNKINEDFFENWSENMAYILGFIAADGCVNVGVVRRLSIHLHMQDLEILERIKKVLMPDKKIYHHNQYCCLQISSTKIFNDLGKLGIHPCKSKTIKWLNPPERFTSHFVRGYVDGDGCVYTRVDRHNEFGCSMVGTKDLLDGIKYAFDSNIGKFYNLKNSPTIWTLNYYCSNAMKFCEWIYENSTPETRLSRKYNIFIAAKNRIASGYD